MILPILCPLCKSGFCKSVKKNKISYVTCRCGNVITVDTLKMIIPFRDTETGIIKSERIIDIVRKVKKVD